MSTGSSLVNKAKVTAMNREVRKVPLPVNENGVPKKVSEFYGENVFRFDLSKFLGQKAHGSKASAQAVLTKDVAELVAQAVTEWALAHGATHFCHWFQPLTGTTAEKHDGFITVDEDRPIEKLSASQLMQGEPDASSFPHGGSRSTFEARGYTTWDVTSPMFITEGPNGKTLYIPTAFVSYHGDALDIKTPLLRSVSRISDLAAEFLNLIGDKDVKEVQVTCGPEQEYFLIDKAFYFLRPDIVMTGRTLFGSMTAKNQQLEDHYFGTIPERVLSFMQELEVELYKAGIPAKTRHNEVAPGQFEIAQIFRDANVAADNNQMVMELINRVAHKHNFMALLHEKPFAGINGSGKHLNWSMSDDKGRNLLEPGKTPHANYRFLAMVAIITEAVHRHAGVLRAAIASHANDHRLGANEAPPSIISVFLGDTLTKIFESIKEEKSFVPKEAATLLDMGAKQLVALLKDNTDRNRTSPFAFTGNKFEFRAVGASSAIGFPLSVLNAAVADVLEEANGLLKKEVASGKSMDQILLDLSRHYIKGAWRVVFNGDGYSEEWVKEAEKRGLPNYRTTPDALPVLKDEKAIAFLTKTKIYTSGEITTRYNVLLERYIKNREIEIETLRGLVERHVFPATINYKDRLSRLIKRQKEIGLESSAEVEIYKRLNFVSESLYSGLNSLLSLQEDLQSLSHEKYAQKMAHELMPLSESIAHYCNELEEIVPQELWSLPQYYDLLFVR